MLNIRIYNLNTLVGKKLTNMPRVTLDIFVRYSHSPNSRCAEAVEIELREGTTKLRSEAVSALLSEIKGEPLKLSQFRTLRKRADVKPSIDRFYTIGDVSALLLQVLPNTEFTITYEGVEKPKTFTGSELYEAVALHMREEFAHATYKGWKNRLGITTNIVTKMYSEKSMLRFVEFAKFKNRGGTITQFLLDESGKVDTVSEESPKVEPIGKKVGKLRRAPLNL